MYFIFYSFFPAQGWYRAFVFCDTLVGNSEEVYDNSDTHPPQNIDSYQSSTGYVLVKFDDFTFNPKFVVYYEEGGYDTDFHLYNDVYFRQHDYNNSSIQDQEWNHEQRVLLKQILRIPFKNEDFLNEIVAENNKCTQIIVQPRPIELPNQTTVIPKDSERTEVDVRRPITKKDSERIEIDAGRPELPSVKDHKGIRHIISPRANMEVTLHPTVLNIVREETGSWNGAQSQDRFAQPPTSPNRKCEKYCWVLFFVMLIVCIVIFDNLFSGRQRFN